MNFNWFSFDYSYLLLIDYKVALCQLTLVIDGRMSIDHPKAKEVKSFEEHFEEIEIRLKGVQYFQTIVSKHISDLLPPRDIGSIDYLNFDESDAATEGFITNPKCRNSSLFLKLGNGIQEMSYPYLNIKVMNFASEMLIFKAGFEEVTIQKSSLPPEMFKE